MATTCPEPAAAIPVAAARKQGVCVVLCNQSSYARMAIALLMLKETLCFVQAIGIRDLLPDVMETLRFANTSIALKASKISRNVMTHVGKREARPIVVELAEKLLPLFSHVSQLLEAEFSSGRMLSLLSLLLWTFAGYLLGSAAQPALSLAAWLVVVV